MSGNHSRRRYLWGLVGACTVGLAGCSGGQSPDDDGEGTATDGASLVGPETMPRSTLGSGWRVPRYSARQTGYNPDASPPRSGPSEAWRLDIGPRGAAEPLLDTDSVVRCDSVTVSRTTGERNGPDRCTNGVLVGVGPDRRYLVERVGTTSGNEESVFRATDPESGDSVWSMREQVAVHESTVTAEAVVARVSADGPDRSVDSLLVLDAGTGDRRWRGPEDAGVRGLLAVDDGAVYVRSDADGGQRLQAYDLATGERRWDRPADFPEYGAVVDGTLYVVESNADTAAVRAVDTDSGSELWRTDPSPPDDGPTSVSLPVAPTVGPNYVFVPNGSAAFPSARRITALDRADGSEAWTTPEVDNQNVGRTADPVVGAGRTLVVAGDDAVRGIDATDGSLLWAVETYPTDGRLALAGDAIFQQSGTTLRKLA